MLYFSPGETGRDLVGFDLFPPFPPPLPPPPCFFGLFVMESSVGSGPPPSCSCFGAFVPFASFYGMEK